MSSNVLGLLLALFLLVSIASGSPSTILNLSRLRREADSQSSSSMPDSATPSATSMSASVTEDASSEESSEGSQGKDMASSTESGKDFESKVKGAISSAEGWVKNQGQNIKNQWDKAKEGIKQAASEVKDKVKKGADQVATRFRNATGSSGEKSECSDKDGNCSTEMPSDSESSSMSPAAGYQKSKRDIHEFGSPTFYESSYSSSGGRDDSSDSNEFSWSKRTRIAGNRDTSNMRYKREKPNKSDEMTGSNSATTASTPMESTSEKGSRSRRESDSQTMTTPEMASTTEKGSRSRRESGSQTTSPEMSSTTEKGSRSRRESGSQTMTTPEMSSTTEKGSRSRRESGSQTMTTPEMASTTEVSSGKSGRRRRDSDSKSGSLPAVNTSMPTTVTEGTVSGNNSKSQSSGSKTRSKSDRYRRDTKSANKTESPTSTEPTTEGSSNEDSYYDEYEDSSHHSKHGGKSGEDDSNFQISVLLHGPPKRKGKSSEAFESEEDAGRSSGDSYHVISHGKRSKIKSVKTKIAGAGNGENMETEMSQPSVSQSHENHTSSILYFPTGSISGESDRESLVASHHDLKSEAVPHTMQVLSGDGSIHTLSSPSGLWRHDGSHIEEGQHAHSIPESPQSPTDDEDRSELEQYETFNFTHHNSRERYSTGNEWELPNSDAERIPMSQGTSDMSVMCPILAPLCNEFQPESRQCLSDEECSGKEKCCFNTCEPYKHLGICEDMQLLPHTL